MSLGGQAHMRPLLALGWFASQLNHTIQLHNWSGSAFKGLVYTVQLRISAPYKRTLSCANILVQVRTTLDIVSERDGGRVDIATGGLSNIGGMQPSGLYICLY